MTSLDPDSWSVVVAMVLLFAFGLGVFIGLRQF